jgi:hypothetical protein
MTMLTQTATRTRRWADILCARCQNTICRDGWPVDTRPGIDGERDLANVFACDDCYIAVDAHFNAGGLFHPFYRRRLDRVMLNAVHEAAHAELAEAVGAAVVEVKLDCTRAGRPRPDGGGVTVVPNIAQLPAIDSAAIYWAGQQASLRWLGQLRPITKADHLDIRFLGLHDIDRALAMIRRSHGGRAVHAELRRGRERADRLLAQRWDALLDLATQLARDGRVEF